jgi:hypothetical protein
MFSGSSDGTSLSSEAREVKNGELAFAVAEICAHAHPDLTSMCLSLRVKKGMRSGMPGFAHIPAGAVGAA